MSEITFNTYFLFYFIFLSKKYIKKGYLRTVLCCKLYTICVKVKTKNLSRRRAKVTAPKHHDIQA